MTLQQIVLVVLNVGSCRSRRWGRRGQVTLEYLIIFAVVAALTLIGLTTFDDNIRNTLQGLFNAAANDMANK